jgi:hypothetical protein
MFITSNLSTSFSISHRMKVDGKHHNVRYDALDRKTTPSKDGRLNGLYFLFCSNSKHVIWFSLLVGFILQLWFICSSTVFVIVGLKAHFSLTHSLPPSLSISLSLCLLVFSFLGVFYYRRKRRGVGILEVVCIWHTVLGSGMSVLAYLVIGNADSCLWSPDHAPCEGCQTTETNPDLISGLNLSPSLGNGQSVVAFATKTKSPGGMASRSRGGDQVGLGFSLPSTYD